jgi:hypothetical protein
VQSGDRYAGHVVNLFGREHLSAGLLGNRHVDSQMCWKDRRLSVVHCPSGRAVTVSSYPHRPVHNFRRLRLSRTHPAEPSSTSFGCLQVRPENVCPEGHFDGASWAGWSNRPRSMTAEALSPSPNPCHFHESTPSRLNTASLHHHLPFA